MAPSLQPAYRARCAYAHGVQDVPPKLQRNFEDTAGSASSGVCKTTTDGPTTQRSVAWCSPPLHTAQWCSIQAACRLNATSPNLQDLVSIKNEAGTRKRTKRERYRRAHKTPMGFCGGFVGTPPARTACCLPLPPASINGARAQNRSTCTHCTAPPTFFLRKTVTSSLTLHPPYTSRYYATPPSET